MSVPAPPLTSNTEQVLGADVCAGLPHTSPFQATGAACTTSQLNHRAAFYVRAFGDPHARLPARRKAFYNVIGCLV